MIVNRCKQNQPCESWMAKERKKEQDIKTIYKDNCVFIMNSNYLILTL